MPGRNIVKQYVEGGYYHAYSRGVEKRVIFDDDQDYLTFIKFLKLTLSPPNPKSPSRLQNFSADVELACYCLMPNHFHMLLSQKTADGMAQFMKSLLTAYTMYFNKRHDRSGRLFETTYKAALVENDAYLIHLSKYIHLNPKKLLVNPATYPYSSFRDYIASTCQVWLNQVPIKQYFGFERDYHDFVFSELELPINLGAKRKN